MNAEQKQRREQAIAELALAFPDLDAEKLQDGIYRIACQIAANAEKLCAATDHEDQRPALRGKLDRLLAKFGVVMEYETSGDPRCPPLRLCLPTGRSNSIDGRTWAICVH